MREGGNQIEYEDEDPSILQLFKEACASNGAPVLMEELISRQRSAASS